MPASKLPLLLATFQYRFGRDLDAMTQHLVDDVAVGWEELGTDLLDGAPPETVAALIGGARWPSRTLDDLITLDGSPPTRMTVTEATAASQDMTWGYVLRLHGIEVIPAEYAPSGPVISWDSDPCTDFSNPATWTTVASAQPPATPTTTPAAPGTRHTSPPKEPACEPHRVRPIRHVR
ncbi:hypothetical protein ACIP4W_11665 [Streptomyces sp. NPDC088846]|uniref:hypothetical protein n=1 Tax=Streptomyces sp. NPDC088846 TaxID=3365908 RepID=UPI0037F65F52